MAATKIHDDLDYQLWASTAKTTLINSGLWDVVANGLPPDPSKLSPTTIQPEELSKWRDLAVKDMEAIQVLQSTLTESSFRKTITASCAKEVWDLRKKDNERRLENQFDQLSMREKESIGSYFDRVNKVVEELRNSKIEKSECEVVKKVLGSLSGSYDGVAPVLEELMDVDNMTFKGLVEFFRRYDSISEDDVNKLLKANRLKREHENKNDSIATSAKWSGPKQFKGKNQEVVVDYIMMARVELNDFVYDEGMWMIYGHATNHISPYEKLFAGLDKTYKAKAGLVDGSFVMAEGIGIVRVVMKDGKKKKITNVLFVPRGINRNVLSVPQMTSRGYSFKPGERGECVVRDKSGGVFGDTTWDERGLSMRRSLVIAPLD